MHLFNLSDFGQQYGIDLTVTDFADAVAGASKAATRALASRFRLGGFDAFTGRRDVFNVRRMFDTAGNSNITLRLSRAFIDGSTGLSAYMTPTPLHIRNSDYGSMTNLQSVAGDAASDYLFIDAQRGVLTVYGVDLTDMWVVVDYNGGFEVATDDEYQGVPDWLQDAARAEAAILIKQNRAFKNEGDTDEDLNPLRKLIYDLQSEHGRYLPSAVLPTMSEPGA